MTILQNQAVTIAAVIILCAAGPAQAAPVPIPAKIRGVLKTYCQGCHGAAKSKGNLRLDRLDPDVANGRDSERWHEALDNLNKGEMPPEGKPQPSDEERRGLVAWLQGGLDEAIRRKQAQAASVLRRLTREQYTNTLQDLLGVPSDYTRLLPPESPSKMGMQNDGQVLASSTLHLEQTMKIARVALDRALSLGAPPPAWRFRFVFGPQTTQPSKKVDLGYQAQPLGPEQFRVETFADRGPVKTATLVPRGNLRDRAYVDLRGSQDYDRKGSVQRFGVDDRGVLLMPAKPHIEREAQIWQGPNPNLGLVLRDFPVEGAFVLRVTVARAQAQGPAPWLRAFVGNRLDDGMAYATFGNVRQVTAAPGHPQVIEFSGRMENLPIPVVDPQDKEFLSNLAVIGVWNDVLVGKAEVTSPALVIKSMEFEGPVTDAWPSASHRRIFFDDTRKSDPESYARQILERFLFRAFRRPPSDAQIQRYVAFWKDRAHAGLPFEEAMRDALAAALCSPNFLHHVEDVADAGGNGARRPLDDFALANRLSYFLWNTMPDDELMGLAQAGHLRPALKAQTLRLLKDPRARVAFESYAAQWLDLGALDRVRVDIKKQPRFTRFVKDDMRTETSRFVEWVFTQNRPLTDLVDADYALLNQNLAQFYGIDGVIGADFRKVVLPKPGRGGGLLSQGSFLVGHSTGEDSHPIKRGVWLAKKLLDDPPPPPPPNVPEIDRENPELAKLSVKAQLELHRNKESCRDCHRKLDPWGIPMEGFDAAGLVRGEIAKELKGSPFVSPVDAAAVLPDGSRVDGMAALKAHLVDRRREQLRRSVARHLAAYALGRTPGFVDEAALKDICAQMQAKGDGLGDLVVAVVASDVFSSK